MTTAGTALAGADRTAQVDRSGEELKTGVDKATPEQAEVLAELEVAGAVVMVAYPHDLERVQRLLRPPPEVR